MKIRTIKNVMNVRKTFGFLDGNQSSSVRKTQDTAYVDISKQYNIPEATKVKGVHTGRVKPGISKSGMAARLGVGYDYDRVVAALTAKKQQ